MLAGVVLPAEARIEARDRRRVDDVAAAASDQHGQERAHPVHDAPEVDAHHHSPGGQGSEPGVAAGDDSCVVADDVDAAEALRRGLGERGDVPFWLTSVRTANVSTPAAPTFSATAAPSALLDIGEDDGQSGRSEALSEREPDATRRL